MKKWWWLVILAAVVAALFVIDLLARGLIARLIAGLWVACMDAVLRLIMPIVS